MINPKYIADNLWDTMEKQLHAFIPSVLNKEESIVLIYVPKAAKFPLPITYRTQREVEEAKSVVVVRET